MDGSDRAVTLSPAAGKARTGRKLTKRVFRADGRVTFIDGLLATAVLPGLALNTVLGAWWADPAASLVIVENGPEARTAPVEPAFGRPA
ncbi:MAG: hypothetical protein ABI720_13085 [Actinomycetes bacterium]